VRNKLFIGLCIVLIFSSFALTEDYSGDPTNWWDTFSDWFLNLFGVESKLQFDLENHDIYGDTQEYILKTSIDNKDKIFDYEIKVLSKKANIKIWLEYYEKIECSHQTAEKTIYYDCSRWIKVTKKQAEQRLLEDNDFSKIRVRRKWGEMPEENCEPIPNSLMQNCTQRVDVVIDYAGRKYVEYAQWSQTTGSWSGTHSGTEESDGKIILSSGTEILADEYVVTDGEDFKYIKSTIYCNNMTIYSHTAGEVTSAAPKLFSTGADPTSKTIDVEIWSHTNGIPTTPLGNCQIQGINESTEAFYNCSTWNTTVTLTAGNAYSICIWSDSSTDNEINWRDHAPAPDTNNNSFYDVGGSWVATADPKYKLYVTSAAIPGSFLSDGFQPDPGTGQDWNIFEQVGADSAECRSSDDNSSWGSFSSATHEADLGIDNKEALQCNFSLASASDELLHFNVSYLEYNEPPAIEPVENITDKSEDFAQFTIDLTINISDDATADDELNFTVVLNNTNVLTLSMDNSTDVGTFDSIANASGNTDINITVWDVGGKQNSTYFSVQVASVNDNPWLNETIANVHLDEDGTDVDVISLSDLQANFSDVEDSGTPSTITLDYENDTTYVDCSIDGSNNLECDAIMANSTGTSLIIVEMNDSGNLNTSFSVEVIIDAINDAPITPTISPSVYTANFSFNGICYDSWDVEGDTIYYTFLFDGNNPPTTAVQNTTDTTFSSDYVNGTYYFMCQQ